jgi:hypothetical protein
MVSPVLIWLATLIDFLSKSTSKFDGPLLMFLFNFRKTRYFYFPLSFLA